METENIVHILDPSDKFRPEKEEAEFRDYTENCAYYDRVKNTYYQMHTNQSYDFATQRLKRWTEFNHGEYTLLEALHCLNSLVDESDPDVDIPNSVHAFQTAERIREAHPDLDWFHLVGLIHDLGKIMAIFGEPQFAVVGDTFAVGCQFSEQCVFGLESFKDNPDIKHPVYSTKTGIYQPNCGLDNVIMSWGHDEYLYRVLMNHDACHLPPEAIYMIRFHSFYPWHTGDDYKHLCSEYDLSMLKWILEFNKFDLYSKADEVPNEDAVLPYYESLIAKYCPGKLKW